MPDYEEKCWDMIVDQLKEIKETLDAQGKEIGKINYKLASILGWAAGAGAVAGIVFAWVKDKLFTKI
jgi:hypothetical protein